ncbi:MAG: hypothetical protein BGO07_01890 [Alphaproteobacteria bacterium 40-19]|nr:MAG: hypothetical protein BGO07_01890 [Alphaproteobacteria bacterium 40-19]
MKYEDRETREGTFFTAIKSSIGRGRIDNDAFVRGAVLYVESFISENEEFFRGPFLIDREDFLPKMAGKSADDCVKVLEELLEKYPDCQEQIKEKFLKTNLDQDLKEKILDAKGWVTPKMCEKKQEDVCEEKGVSAANRREAFSGQGIMIGGSDLDDKHSADSGPVAKDIENLKKENRDLFSENTRLKQLLKEKNAIIEKFYRFQKEQQDVLLGLKNSGAEFIKMMKSTEEKAEANADASRKNRMRSED